MYENPLPPPHVEKREKRGGGGGRSFPIFRDWISSSRSDLAHAPLSSLLPPSLGSHCIFTPHLFLDFITPLPPSPPAADRRRRRRRTIASEREEEEREREEEALFRFPPFRIAPPLPFPFAHVPSIPRFLFPTYGSLRLTRNSRFRK